MRERRSRNHAEDISRIIRQYKENEDAAMDMSNTIDHVPVDTTNDLPITMIDCSTSSFDSEHSDEFEINSDDITDDDVDVEAESDDDGVDVDVEAKRDDDDVEEFINISTLKEVLESNEPILKKFIQQKCLILDEYLPHTWSRIMNSMAQMPYDAVKYKPKSNNNSLSQTPKLNDTTTTTIALSPINTNENEP
ncbi:unnamed protein product [Rotaria sp. Silwood1]|nr:unnamed protein product [Rotaria sp. Silwood1]CAF1643059.1 unnamed protein product [Rotaria sp. Silwood1]